MLSVREKKNESTEGLYNINHWKTDKNSGRIAKNFNRHICWFPILRNKFADKETDLGGVSIQEQFVNFQISPDAKKLNLGKLNEWLKSN